MITVTKQTEQEQIEMYSKMLKADVIDMLIESNKHLNRILENTLPIYGVVKSDSEKLLAYTKFLRNELHLNITDTWVESYKKNSK